MRCHSDIMGIETKMEGLFAEKHPYIEVPPVFWTGG